MNKNDKEFMVQKIRSQYMEKGTTQLDELKTLDAAVKRPANVYGYTFGTIAAIIMGSGMSLTMTDIGEKIGMTDVMPTGIAIGVIGMFMAIINYPVYKAILSARKKKYAEQIMQISDKIMGAN